jgi:hypothetical protein
MARYASEFAVTPNNQFERSRGYHIRCAKEGVDDRDKSASSDVVEAPRRSVSSLGV